MLDTRCLKVIAHDSPLQQPSDIVPTLDVNHGQHHGVAFAAVHMHVFDVELKVRQRKRRIRHQVLDPLLPDLAACGLAVQ